MDSQQPKTNSLVGGVETKTDEEIAHAFAVNISNIGLLDSDRPFIELAAKDILSAIREARAADSRETK